MGLLPGNIFIVQRNNFFVEFFGDESIFQTKPQQNNRPLGTLSMVCSTPIYEVEAVTQLFSKSSPNLQAECERHSSPSHPQLLCPECGSFLHVLVRKLKDLVIILKDKFQPYPHS